MSSLFKHGVDQILWINLYDKFVLIYLSFKTEQEWLYNTTLCLLEESCIPNCWIKQFNKSGNNGVLGQICEH